MDTSTLLFLVVMGIVLKAVGSFMIWASIAKNVENYIKKVRANENDKG